MLCSAATTSSGFWAPADPQNGCISPNAVPLVETRGSEREEIRDWNLNHVGRPNELLSLNLGPLITNLGMIFSGHFTGLVVVKPLWWSCWWFYLVKLSPPLWACSVHWNPCQGQLDGMSNWRQQSRAPSPSLPALPTPPLDELGHTSGSGFFSGLPSLFWFSNDFFIQTSQL